MHRLNVVRLRLPPLRERGEDIAPLRIFLQKARRISRRAKGPSEACAARAVDVCVSLDMSVSANICTD